MFGFLRLSIDAVLLCPLGDISKVLLPELLCGSRLLLLPGRLQVCEGREIAGQVEVVRAVAS